MSWIQIKLVRLKAYNIEFIYYYPLMTYTLFILDLRHDMILKSAKLAFGDVTMIIKMNVNEPISNQG